MSEINAETLSELFESFPKAIVKVDGDKDIAAEFEVDCDGKAMFNLIKKTAESEAQSGQNQSV